jgi:hypothetical protein
MNFEYGSGSNDLINKSGSNPDPKPWPEDGGGKAGCCCCAGAREKAEGAAPQGGGGEEEEGAARVRPPHSRHCRHQEEVGLGLRIFYTSVGWIRIRIAMALRDPVPYWGCGYGSRS